MAAAVRGLSPVIMMVRIGTAIPSGNPYGSAAVLAFIPLTFSVFWGSMAYILIGGTAVGTVLALLFLLHSIQSGSE